MDAQALGLKKGCLTSIVRPVEMCLLSHQGWLRRVVLLAFLLRV